MSNLFFKFFVELLIMVLDFNWEERCLIMVNVSFCEFDIFLLCKLSVKMFFFLINVKKCGLNFIGRKDMFLIVFIEINWSL